MIENDERRGTLLESELIGLARQGDAGAWGEVVLQHQEAIFRLAYLFLGDPDEAEDVAQEAFMRAYAALASFDRTRPLRPWLFSIAANLARNRQRSFARYLAALKRFAAERRPAAAGRGDDTGGLVQQKGDAAALWQAVRRLSTTHQEAIYLRFFVELSESEMSEVWQVPAGTVKSRLNRALRQLRATIETEFPELKEGMNP